MKTKSFTLIELLVVIVIIGILAGVIVVSTSSAIQKANFAKAQAFSSTVRNELFSDLVSEWTFDNASNPAEDTGGNNDGTVTGATYKPRTDGVCVYGGCYSFNGSNNYIEINNSNLPTNTLSIANKITVSSWVNTTVTNQTTIISKSSSYLLRKTAGNSASFIIWNSTSWDYSTPSSKSINDGVWHNVVGVYDGSYIKLYVDGAEQSPGVSFAGGISISSSFVDIGRKNSTDDYWNGLIDDIRIYDDVLSSAQIKEQYLAGLDSLLSSNQISQEDYNQRLNNLAYEK